MFTLRGTDLPDERGDEEEEEETEDPERREKSSIHTSIRNGQRVIPVVSVEGGRVYLAGARETPKIESFTIS